MPIRLSERDLHDAEHLEAAIAAAGADGAIGSIADISTFNRQFKRRYGMTPTEARAAAALPASPERQARRR